MRCTRCKKNNAKYEICYLTGLNRGSEFLCDKCFKEDDFYNNSEVRVRPVAVMRCSKCGTSMDEYLQSGLLGCAKCYEVFKENLQPYIDRLQGDKKHMGKAPPYGEKYDITVALQRAKALAAQAETAGDFSAAEKQERKAAELELLLFNDGEEEV